MTYIKLLTVLAGLALLTACGGGTAKDPKLAGDGTGGNATNCTTNPFHADCSADAPALILRRTMCLADTTADPLCTGATGIATVFCTANPFDTSNACMADTYLPLRLMRQTQCVADSTAHTNCATVLAGIVTTADWVDSFTGNDALPTTPNTTPTNEFLAITATTASTLTAELVPTTLFMTGSTTNGIAFFRENGAYYAGILAGTNLGAPITETITTAVKWSGQIYAIAINVNGTLGAGDIDDFGLDITFDGTRGTMKTVFPVSGFAYSIDGTFDENGIIGGSVAFGAGTASGLITTHSTYSLGTLTGIIGQNGAVGAFISGDSVPRSFSGGFVALPPAFDGQVDYDDWLAIGETVAMPSTPVKNEFISGILAAGVPDEDGSVANHRSYGANTLNNAIHKDGTFGGDGNDGVVPVNATNGSYVGILPTTNLGAPLTEPTASAEWQGVLWGAHTRTSERGSFTPTINFTAKTITGTVADRAVDDTDFAVISGNNFPTGVNYSFTASFDNPRGQLTGTITRTVDSVASAGTIRGIIGEEGAVAGFISDAGADLSYAGGFVARPTPSE